MSAVLPPKVFVSYSHDSEAHEQRVLALADQLRKHGIDVRLDQYVDNPAEGWLLWMQRQLTESDFVVLVCTPIYRQRFNREDTGGAGKGAKWEAMIAEQLLYEAEARNDKLIPVLFDEGEEKDVPLVLRAYTRYRLMGEYDRLYRRLTGQHETPAPPLGAIRVMPPKARPGLGGGTQVQASTAGGGSVGAGGGMATTVVITEDMLVDELAQVIADEGRARLVLQRAKFPAGQTPAFRMPLVFWSTVVGDARHGVIAGGVRALVVEAARLVPGNAVFQRYLGQ
jgi:hypothetical protein